MKVVEVLVILCCVSFALSADVQLGTCYLKGTSVDSGITGKVTFTQLAGGAVSVVAVVSGVSQRTDEEHGMHIHQWGDLTAADGSSAGGHWNPAGVNHGCPDGARHIGDMGNWTVDSLGQINQNKTLDLLTLTGGNSLIGRTVILHLNSDDCVTQPVGNAGSRLAHCVIGLAAPDVNTDTNTASASPGITKAICNVVPTSGNNVTGTVMLIQNGGTGATRVIAHLTGLDGNQHGFHIHEFGDVSSISGTAAGGHYNPEDVHHAIPPFPTRHVGDMGNIVYYVNGSAWYDYTNDMISLNGEYSVVGRTIIVHENQDNCESPVGLAGSRWGQCVIGIMDPARATLDVPTETPTTQDETPCYDIYTTPGTDDSSASVRSIILPLIAALAAFCHFF